MHRFRICTLVTRPEQYVQMQASFRAAGFADDTSVFEAFDNTSANAHDPFHVLTDVLGRAAEPYVIFCHQDVLLNCGDTAETLDALISEVDRVAPEWAVLGNAGIDEDYRKVIRITDPYGTFDDAATPRRVLSVDENFMVIRTGAGVGITDGLYGFHLYGLDLGLNAYMAGRTCHVIDFHLTHLSGGDFGTAFEAAVGRFAEAWKSRLRNVYVDTVCTPLFISDSRLVAYVMRRRRVRALVRRAFPGWARSRAQEQVFRRAELSS